MDNKKKIFTTRRSPPVYFKIFITPMVSVGVGLSGCRNPTPILHS